MKAALDEIVLGRFAGEISSDPARRASTREAKNESSSIMTEWREDLVLLHGSRRLGSKNRLGDQGGQAEIHPFPYLELIRAALREGEISAAKKLLALATGQGQQVSDDLARLQQLLGPAKVRKSPAKGVDRTPEFRWLKVHGAEYEGQWVAVSGDRLVAHAARLKDLLAEIGTLRLDRTPLIHKIS